MVITTSVAVLGAGWSGVSASYELAQGGVDFVLVEGGSHLGGRTRKMEVGGYTVEDSSNWIQGVGNIKKGHANPIWELAAKYGLDKIKKKKHPFKNVGGGSIQQNYDSYVVYDEAGNSVKDKDIRWDALEEGYACLDQEALEFNLAYWQTGFFENRTVRDVLTWCGWVPESNMDDVIEWFEGDWEFGTAPESALVYQYPVFAYQDYGPEDEFIIDQRGFQYLVEQFAGEFLELEDNDPRLLMETVVEQIKWQPNNCPSEFPFGCVEITTNSNEKIIAEHAIVTFSSGVLNVRDDLFEPPLPDINKDALATLGRGLYMKIFFQFETKFWDDTEFIVTATKERGASNVWQNLDQKKQLPGSRIIFQTLTEDLAEEAEGMTDSEIQEEQLGYLRNIYGDAVSAVTDFHVARFLNDPLFYQAWGEWGLETPPNVIDLILEPIYGDNGNRTLWISGEHTCRRHFGFTHGAYLAGKRTAREVLMAMGEENVENETACENQEAPDAGPPYGNKGKANGQGNRKI